MHDALSNLIARTSRLFQLENDELAELMSVCFAYAHLLFENKLTAQNKPVGKITLVKLQNVLSNQLGFTTPAKIFKTNRQELDNKLVDILSELNQLLTTSHIDNFHLFIAVKELHATIDGTYTIPDELCELALLLVSGNINTVYCPFEKGCDFILYLPTNNDVTIETSSENDVFYAKIQSTLLNQPVKIIKTDPINTPRQITGNSLKQFDAVIAMPPMGARINKESFADIWGRFPETSLMAEVYFLRHMLAHTKERAVCFVSDGFLFRTAAGERLFKEEVIESNWLEGVIALPSGLLNHTSISVNAMVFNKTRPNQSIKFLNASTDAFIEKLSKARGKLRNAKLIVKEFTSHSDGDNSTSVKPDKVFKNEYNLSPARYVKSCADKKFEAFMSHFKSAQLKELVDIFRPQALQHDESGDTVLHEYGANNLNDINHLSGEPRVVRVNRHQLKRIEKQKVQPNDVLVVCRGAVGKAGYVPEGIKGNALVNQAFTILRVKPGCRRMSPQALFQYLSSEYGKHQLTSLATGTSAPMLSSKDIQALTVPAFSKVQQEAFAVAHQQAIEKQEKIDTLQKELAELRFDLIEGMASLS
ncbi:N-6 DNA methylase [Alishewanella sp. HL-SH05]|uniref:N-6 DNA methylase n=1 Tax=Alishewanella sp. HL-SH05 TaxID=3461145 RepID=UPI0040415DE0